MNITEDQFDEDFRPVQNPHNKDASWNGCLFETYGVEFNFVKSQPKNKVWTVTDEGGVVSGLHLVNRVGYIVTEVPWTEETEVII